MTSNPISNVPTTNILPSTSNVPDVNLDDFKDWNSKSTLSTVSSIQNNKNSFNADWNSFPSSNVSANPVTQMDFTKLNSFNNTTNFSNLNQPNLSNSTKNPFASPSQLSNPNFNQLQNKGFGQNNPINPSSGADPFQSFNQFGFGSQSQNQPQRNQPTPQQKQIPQNQTQSQWSQSQMQSNQIKNTYSSQMHEWNNPSQGNGNLSQQSNQMGVPQSKGQTVRSQQQNYSQNYYDNPQQNFTQNQNSQGYGKEEYHQNQVDDNPPEKTQNEARPNITGNNPLRYIQTTGMSALRGKR